MSQKELLCQMVEYSMINSWLLQLRELIPNNIKIYVKEHPSMFYKSTWGYRGRSPIFYNLLNNISNVQILSNEYKSVELIRASIFTATISGTVGFESAVIGKKALILEIAGIEGVQIQLHGLKL